MSATSIKDFWRTVNDKFKVEEKISEMRNDVHDLKQKTNDTIEGTQFKVQNG